MPEPFASLTGKRALVTGASRGIGAAIARELASGGCAVVIGYLGIPEEAEGARALAAELGAEAIEGDVSKPESAQALVEQAGEIDVLVNNAGITRDGLLVRMSDADWDELMAVNLNGVFYTCRAAVRGMMRRRSGSIVNLSSVVGVHGNPGQTNYSASKAGVIGFTKSLAREAGARGVRANAVAPGYIQTRLTDVLPDEVKEMMLKSTPLARFGTVEDVARVVRFLCSDEASFVTGEVILVDGGLGM